MRALAGLLGLAAAARAGGPAPWGVGPEVSATMKSWASLRRSLGRLGREAAEVQLVAEDVGRMRGDLAAQEALWRQADVELEAEKTSLRAQLTELKKQVQAEPLIEPHLDAEVDNLRKQAEFAQMQSLAQQRESDRWKAQVDVQRKLLQRNQQQLLSQLANMSAVADQDLRRARREQRGLQAEGKALLLRAGEIQQRLREEREETLEAEQRAADRAAELQRQVGELDAARQRASGGLRAREDLAQDLAQVQQQLQGQTAAIVQVRQEQAELVGHCEKEKKKRGEVLSAEREKLARQRRGTLQLCGAAHGQYGLLRQMLRSCEAQTGGRG